MLDRVSVPDWGFDPGFWGLPQIIANVTGEASLLFIVPCQSVVRRRFV